MPRDSAALRALFRLLIPVVLCLAVASCAALPWPGRDGETFLRAGPLQSPAAPHAVDAVGRPDPRTGPPGLLAGMPADLSADGGLRPLPHAAVPGVGPVDALVLSVSLGAGRPAFGELDLGRAVFGAGPDDEGTVAGLLGSASGGRLRMRADVLPTLVDTRAVARHVAPTPAELERLAQEALATWARDTALARWDNDGPDGLPASGDDDGRLDLVVVAVETDVGFASFVSRRSFTLRTRDHRVRVEAVHLLSVPRTETLGPDAALGLALQALGLASDEWGWDGDGVSPLARARLGWLPLRALESGEAVLDPEHGLVAPLDGVAHGAGFWLIDTADQVHASRVVRRADGGFVATEARRWAGDGELLLPLDRRLGERGPVVRLGWGRAGPVAQRFAAGALSTDSTGADATPGMTLRDHRSARPLPGNPAAPGEGPPTGTASAPAPVEPAGGGA